MIERHRLFQYPLLDRSVIRRFYDPAGHGQKVFQYPLLDRSVIRQFSTFFQTPSGRFSIHYWIVR